MSIFSIIPIDDLSARLIDIHGEVEADCVFSKLGKYEGFNNVYSPDEIRIYHGEYHGKLYNITQIQSCSFSHCRNVKTIIIGPQVESINWNMYQCISLENIYVDRQNPIFHDKNGVLYNGSELIAFPQGRKGHYAIPFGTTKIGNHAFKSCNLTSITFPETLKEIGINAFYDCRGISEFILPKSIQKVHLNCNQSRSPIKQKFYLSSDIRKTSPLTINDIITLFPA